jgi:hypothetical protein
MVVPKSVERRTISATISGAISFLAAFAQSTVIVPILLAFWNREKYGVWLSISAFIALTQTIDTGHQTFVGNEINMAWFSNPGEMRRILASSLWIAAALATVVTVAVGIMPASDIGKLMGIADTKELNDARLAVMALMLSWAITGSWSGILGRLLIPAGLLNQSIWWGIVARLVNMVSVIVAVRMHGGIRTAAIASSAAATIVSGGLVTHIWRKFPELRPFYSGASITLGFKNFGRSLVTSCANTTLQLQVSWLVLLIAASVGSERVPTFSTLKTLTNAFVQVTTIVSVAVMPELVRYHARRESEKLGAALGATWLGSGTAVNLLIVGTLPLVEPTYAWWTHHAIPFDRVLYGYFAASVAFRNLGAPLTGYLGGINQLKAQSVIAAASLSGLAIAGISLLTLGFKSLGPSLLLGDVISAFVVPLYFTRRELVTVGMKLTRAHLGSSLLSTAVVCTCILLASTGTVNLRIVSVSGLLCISALGFRQYLELPQELRLRLGSLFGQV